MDEISGNLEGDSNQFGRDMSSSYLVLPNRYQQRDTTRRNDIARGKLPTNNSPIKVRCFIGEHEPNQVIRNQHHHSKMFFNKRKSQAVNMSSSNYQSSAISSKKSIRKHHYFSNNSSPKQQSLGSFGYASFYHNSNYHIIHNKGPQNLHEMEIHCNN